MWIISVVLPTPPGAIRLPTSAKKKRSTMQSGVGRAFASSSAEIGGAAKAGEARKRGAGEIA
ncbi:MAG: hypothetical protein Q8Q28_05460, partial [Pseudomonadota bacterium]|nr:hypothetical protein [Pseudomonadota bacterium]